MAKTIDFKNAESKINSIKESEQTMPNDYMYVFECDYGSRTKEKQFIKDILLNFDKDYATMVGAMVNNNPYSLEFYIAVNLQDDPIKFEKWVRENYPEKLKRHNVFLNSLMSFNLMTFIDEEAIDQVVIDEGGGPLFHWLERELLESKHPQYKPMKPNQSRVFISHSSKDKERIVNPLNSYLQAHGIATWLDSYEIDYGDNIYIKVNEGIEKSDVGILVLTNNFFDNSSGWPITEFSTFFMELMKGNKKVIMLNAGVDPEKIHSMMRAYRYLDWNDGKGLPELGNSIKKKLDS